MKFVFFKLDASTGLPLANATFQLVRKGTVVKTATSESNGIVNFGFLAPGTYELTEISTPFGYLLNDSVYQVTVRKNGSITVDGVVLDDFRVEDMKLPGFSFTKTSYVTLLPLAGAVFELRQNSNLIGIFVSDLTGFVAFPSLLPGSYQLTEAEAPIGYLCNSSIYEVTVSIGGNVTIDGVSCEKFAIENMAKSVPPIVNDVYEYDPSVTGTGMPDSRIDVTLHDGTTLSTTVLPDGRWFVTAPPISLQSIIAGASVTTIQTEYRKLPSDPEKMIVQ